VKTTCCGAGAVYPFLTVRERSREGRRRDREVEERTEGRKISKAVRLSGASPQFLPFLFGTLVV
jgi:hypothetical protein